MSEQPKDRSDETQSSQKSWEQPEKAAKPVLTSDQARKKKEKLIMIIMIVLAVVMVLAVSVMLLYRRWVKKPELPPGPGPSASAAESKNPGADPSTEPSVEPTPYFDGVQPKVSGERKSEDIFTFLIFGSDVVSGLTDTIMVATYDVTNQQATVMSIPRDTLVNVRSAYKNINGVYGQNGRGESGTDALKREVSELLGYAPDYCVMINWELVGKMVDAIGGVWYDIPYHMDYDDPDQDLHIHFDTGNQFLNGEDAMKVVRWRENNRWSPYYGEGGGSDITRLGNQHGFLKAVLKQTLQPQNIVRIPELIRLFNENVVSDLAVENMLWFGQQVVVGGLGVDDVEFCTMPFFGVYQGVYKNRVYPNQTELLKLINEKLNPFVEEVTIRELDLIRVSADGDTLSSSTGVLADPSAAIPPVRESDPPEESDPSESDPPEEGDPSETDPPEGGDPLESGPPEGSDPEESSPPGESDPVESESPDIPPVTGQPEPSREPAEGETAGNPEETDP